mmetsp:Transcript_30256/g.96418  ORF Transcript_30256/g.96418 Transcript_30256/m.96418 type:complete len:185 (-) Transcript_30256:59-613(-)
MWLHRSLAAVLIAHVILHQAQAFAGLSNARRESTEGLRGKAIEFEREADEQVLRNRLSSARAHLKDVVLRIEDYTNQFEMGVRKNPGWTPADADELAQRLAHPMKKVLSALQEAQEDLVARPAASSGSLLQHAIRSGEQVEGMASKVVADVRTGKPTEALKNLSAIRDAFDVLDQALSQNLVLT